MLGFGQVDSMRQAFFERIESVHLALLLYVRSYHGSPLNELGWQLCAG